MDDGGHRLDVHDGRRRTRAYIGNFSQTVSSDDLSIDNLVLTPTPIPRSVQTAEPATKENPCRSIQRRIRGPLGRTRSPLPAFAPCCGELPLRP